MNANIWNITHQNMAMRKLLKQMQGQADRSILPYAPQGYYPQEDKIKNQSPSHQHVREDSPLEREVGMDIPSNS